VRRLLALLLVLPALLAGCGASGDDSASDFQGEERKVADVVEDLEEAATEDEPKRICEGLLAKEVVDGIEGDCAKAVEKAIDDADTFTLTVEDVTVKGTTATARVETGDDEEAIEEITLVKEGDGWRISRLPAAS
jgi:hypothetical protein